VEPRAEELTDRLFRYGHELVHILVVSGLWLGFAWPLVTIPAATAAAYASLLTHAQGGSRAYGAGFWTTFRASFRTVTARGLGLFALIGLCAFDIVYYTRGDAGPVLIGLAVVQGALGLAAAVLATHWLAGQGRHWAQQLAGPAPGLRDAARVSRARGWTSVLIGLVCLGVPGFFVVTGLWQFAVLAPGTICYLNAQLLVAGPGAQRFRTNT
jgi:hypothetical protein